MKFRLQYDDERDTEEGVAAETTNDEPSLTRQSFTADADINIVMKRFGITDGSLPPALVYPDGVELDLTDAPTDFRDAQDRLLDAKNRFMQLEATLRARFHNDPLYMHDWVTNPDNAEEAVALGLLKKQEAPEPPAPPAPPTTQT